MKYCTKCQKKKSLSEFARNRRKPSGYQDWCKPCKNDHHLKYYADNKVAWQIKATAYRKRIRAQINDLKRGPCTDCERCFDPVCMDWDHLDAKIRNVSNMVGHYSWEGILAEIAKCELVCACCHRLRTKARSSSG